MTNHQVPQLHEIPELVRLERVVHLVVSHVFLVFGVDLEFLLEREAGGAQPEVGAIPSVMQICLSEVESRGLDEVGICMFRLRFLL
jgi:hypothetical protein